MPIAISIFTSLAASGGLVWLFRSWISSRLENSIHYEYNAKLEQLKAEMAKDHAVAIERFKSETEASLRERLIRFEKLHAKQAEVVAELYRRLSKAKRAVEEYVSIAQGPEAYEDKKIVPVINAFEALQTFFDESRIYLTTETATKVDVFVLTMTKQARSFQLNVVRRVDLTNRDENWGNWKKINDFVLEQAPKLFDQLENDFRRMLGHNGVLDEKAD